MLNEQSQWIVEQLATYVEASTARCAVGLEAPWGAGKTTFAKMEVAEVVKQKGKKLVHASLFGVSTAEELYGRLVMAQMHVQDSPESKGKTVVKQAVKSFSHNVGVVLKKIGIPLSFSVSMKTLFEIIASDRYVYVLDDLERCGKEADPKEIFGAVNQMIEGMGLKVILISTSFEEEGEGGVHLPAEIKDKLLSRVFIFKPDLGVAISEIFKDVEKADLDVNFVSCIKKGIEGAGCENIRTLIRGKDLVDKICMAQCLVDESIPCINRESALTDIVQLVFRVLSGNPPECPPIDLKNGLTGLDSHDMRERDLFIKSQGLSFVTEYYRGDVIDIENRIDRAVLNYLSDVYPTGREDLEIIRVRQKLQENLLSLGDAEAASLAHSLSNALKTSRFAPSLLPDAVTINCFFRDLGFYETLSDDELMKVCIEVVRCHPDESLRYLQGDSQYIVATDEMKVLLGKLSEAAKRFMEEAEEAFVSSLQNALSDDDSLGDLVELLSRVSPAWVRSVCNISADRIAVKFVNGSVEDQLSFLHFLAQGFLENSVCEADKEALGNWFKSLGRALEVIDAPEKMGILRKRRACILIESCVAGMKDGC